jgi:hypothetical protein
MRDRGRILDFVCMILIEHSQMAPAVSDTQTYRRRLQEQLNAGFWLMPPSVSSMCLGGHKAQGATTLKDNQQLATASTHHNFWFTSPKVANKDFITKCGSIVVASPSSLCSNLGSVVSPPPKSKTVLRKQDVNKLMHWYTEPWLRKLGKNLSKQKGNRLQTLHDYFNDKPDDQKLPL